MHFIEEVRISGSDFSLLGVSDPNVISVTDVWFVTMASPSKPSGSLSPLMHLATLPQDQLGRNALYYALGNQVPETQWEVLKLGLLLLSDVFCGLSQLSNVRSGK